LACSFLTHLPHLGVGAEVTFKESLMRLKGLFNAGDEESADRDMMGGKRDIL
jgi:hypothetical protein